MLKAQVTESQFADDLALYAVTCTAFESTSKSFVEVASCFGVTVSLPRTKGLAVGAAVSEVDVFPVVVEGGENEIVEGLLIWVPSCWQMELKLTAKLLRLLRLLVV